LRFFSAAGKKENLMFNLRFMKMLFVLCVMLVSFTVFAQQRDLPTPPRQMPGRDGVMVIDRIAVGRSKQYNWHGNKATIELTGTDSGGCIDLRMGGKKLLTNHRLTKNKKTISLSLTKKVNYLVVAASKSNSAETVKANILLSGSGMNYHINLECTKSLKDTIIINKR
jgi:hypothetical protein